MQNTRARVVAFGVLGAWGMWAALACGQEATRKDDPQAAAKKEREVITLRDAALQVEAQTVGTVRAGDKLVAEEVQGDWCWVRVGAVRGWIERASVVDAEFKARCEREGDLSTGAGAFAAWMRGVDKSGCASAKILGVSFELTALKTPCYPNIQAVIAGGIIQVGVGNVYNGPSPEGVQDNVSVDYFGVKLAVVKLDEQWRTLSVNGTPYGNVNAGDHVLIRGSREVFVNGLVRTAAN